MAGSLRESGRMISGMVRDLRDIQMATLTLVILKWVKHMAKVFILGVMVKFMMVNGTKV